MTRETNLTRFTIKPNKNAEGMEYKYVYMKDDDTCKGAIIFKEEEDLWYASTVNSDTGYMVLYYPCESKERALQVMQREAKDLDYCLIHSGAAIKLPSSVEAIETAEW